MPRIVSPGLNPVVDEERLWRRTTALAAMTEANRPFTRLAFSVRYREARRWLAAEMAAAGLVVSTDAAGNIVGGVGPADAPSIAVGSHIDTVPEGGRFDGVAGVVTALEAVDCLKEAGIELRHRLEVFDFLAEEPNVYGASCVGSRGLAGLLTPSQLAAKGPEGDDLASAIASSGGSPEQLTSPLKARGDIAAFVELHIEQGPVLEARHLDVGIVSGIVGITRWRLTIRGSSSHAGTTPMRGRRDALVGAAIIVQDVEARALAKQGNAGYVVATIGHFDVRPNGANVVPGQVGLVLEVRSDVDAVASGLCDEILAAARKICLERGLNLDAGLITRSPAVQCDAIVLDAIADAAASRSITYCSLASGAGHDAACLSNLAPVGMIFIPCRAGLSHHPDEWTEPANLTRGAQVLLDAVRLLDARVPVERRPIPHRHGSQS